MNPSWKGWKVQVGLLQPGHSVVPTPATRQRLLFEFLPTVQDAFPSAVVYIVRRDVAKGLVVPLGVVPGDEADADRLGGPEHRYWKKRLAEDLRARGYDVTEECPLGGGKAIDLVATRNGERVALEIETGKSDVLANVKKCLGAGLDKVIIMATSRKTEEVAKTLAIQYPQVECVAAGNVVKTLASRFLVAGRPGPFAGGGTGTRTRISPYTMVGEGF